MIERLWHGVLLRDSHASLMYFMSSVLVHRHIIDSLHIVDFLVMDDNAQLSPSFVVPGEQTVDFFERQALCLWEEEVDNRNPSRVENLRFVRIGVIFDLLLEGSTYSEDDVCSVTDVTDSRGRHINYDEVLRGQYHVETSTV